MIKDKFRVIMKEDYDEELNALSVCFKLLNVLSFNQQHRVLNYLLVRLFNRAWAVVKPKEDE